MGSRWLTLAPGREKSGKSKVDPRLLVLAFVVTVAIGVGEGYVARRMFDARQVAAVGQWRARLGQAAEQQTSAIGAWVTDFVGDAQVIASFPMVRRLLSPDGAPLAGAREDENARDHFGKVLESFIRLHKYRAACLVDGEGRVIAASGEGLQADVIGRERARAEPTGSSIAVVQAGSQTRVVAAALAPPGSGAGAVLLVADPQDWLYPQLSRQPVSSLTSEYLLVGTEGGRPVLVAPVRQLVGPVPAHGFPSAVAPSRMTRETRGAADESELDYRGVAVITASRRIDGTPWNLVAKIDRAEAFGAVQEGAWGTVIWWGAIIVALVAVVHGLLRHRQTIHVREQLEATEQIGFLNRLLRTISEVNELMVREKDRQRLLEETCRTIVEHAGFRMCWFGETSPSYVVRPAAWAGAVEGYLDGIVVRYDDSPEGRGPTGTSIRERRPAVVEDVATAPTMVPWREKALARGYRSVAAVPLVQGERVLGALTVYSEEAGILRGEALSLLEKLASDLAFAVEVMERGERHRETERALSESEEQLRQAQKMEAIGRLAGGVAHDFNNLLMAISGYAELALSARTDESRRERIEEIATAADRAAALTRQLLAFSRKQVLQPRVFNLNAAVAEIEKMLRRLIGENIELVASLAPGLHDVRADQGQLEQVLVNLVVNARDAMPHGGRLVIETRNEEVPPGEAPAGSDLVNAGSYVVLSVTDSGEGMGPETLDHLFEPFFTTKATGKGTGLGLSMVYGIVKQSGGGIAVDSAPGRGSTFSVYLPVATPEEEISEAAALAPVARHGGESLLVVEDNAAVRSFVNEALRSAGYEVIDAESAERGLELLAKGDTNIDLLLTDVVLPKMDGYELARQAASRRPSLRVLFMSGYVDNPRLREAALHEGIDLIEKPFTSAAIAARVRAVLDRPPVPSA